MAFTFTKVSYDPAAKVATYSATTDASSAAGTITCGFVPVSADVFDSTNSIWFHWHSGMPNGSSFKTALAVAYDSADGFTPVSTTAQQGITLGTDLHTNSSTYYIILKG